MSEVDEAVFILRFAVESHCSDIGSISDSAKIPPIYNKVLVTGTTTNLTKVQDT